MMPEGVLSTRAVPSGSVDPAKRPGDFLIDYERAGVGINDPSQGLRTQVWKLEIERDDGDQSLWHVFVSAPSVTKTLLFSETDIQEGALAFDQNMRPFVAYVQAGVTKFWWYDSTIPAQITTTLGTGYRSPRCTMDEKRDWHSNISDILLFYIRNGNLCERIQRERYQVEHVHKSVGPDAELVAVFMGTGNRITIRLRNSTLGADDGASVASSPLLSDIVVDLCGRAGIAQDNLDVNDLYGEIVSGYPIASDGTTADHLKPLSEAFFFDPIEHGRKLRFIRRGRSSVMRIRRSDLVDVRNGSFKQKRIQEDKLPIRVDVNHLDPAGGFAKNKQTAYRKTNLVSAKGNRTIDLPFAAEADQAATIALKNIKVAWHEPMTYEWALPLKFAELVPGDVFEYDDEEGSIFSIRIEDRSDEPGMMSFIGRQDGGAAVYGTKMSGQSLPPPISTTPGLVGPTRVEIINASPFRDQDDELGVYVALAGETDGWYGASLLVSTDEISYVEAYRTETPATLGETEDDLAIGDTSVIVSSNFDLESTDESGIANNANRCVIGDEILQFTTAQFLGGGRWLLQGLIRGDQVHGTPEEDHISGTRFVLIDSGITFVQAERWMLDKTLWAKAVSYGTNEDDATPVGYDLDDPASQTEWRLQPPTLTIDGGIYTLTVSPRPRLGSLTNRYQSKYFAGYRYEFSDGEEVDTLSPVYEVASPPSGLQVRVAGLNSITGPGPMSDWVTLSAGGFQFFWQATGTLVDSPGWGGYTLRQVIPLSGMAGPASEFRITLRANSEGVQIASCYMQKSGGGTEYSFADTPVPVTFAGSASVTIPPNGTAVSDPVPLALTTVDNLVMSLYCTIGGIVRIPEAGTGFRGWYIVASDAAAQSASGYSPGPVGAAYAMIAIEKK